MFVGMKKYVVITADKEVEFSDKVSARDYARHFSKNGRYSMVYKRWKINFIYVEELMIFENGSLYFSERRESRDYRYLFTAPFGGNVKDMSKPIKEKWIEWFNERYGATSMICKTE